MENNLKIFGNKKDGTIISVNEEKLTLDYIEQIRNYLNVQEIKLKNHGRNIRKNKI